MQDTGIWNLFEQCFHVMALKLFYLGSAVWSGLIILYASDIVLHAFAKVHFMLLFDSIMKFLNTRGDILIFFVIKYNMKLKVKIIFRAYRMFQQRSGSCLKKFLKTMFISFIADYRLRWNVWTFQLHVLALHLSSVFQIVKLFYKRRALFQR